MASFWVQSYPPEVLLLYPPGGLQCPLRTFVRLCTAGWPGVATAGLVTGRSGEAARRAGTWGIPASQSQPTGWDV